MEYIYIISSRAYRDDIYKIGRTTVAKEKLLKSYTRQLGEPMVELFLAINDGHSRKVEKEIHNRLQHRRFFKRKTSEIFNGDLNYFKRICYEVVDAHNTTSKKPDSNWCSMLITLFFFVLISFILYKHYVG